MTAQGSNHAHMLVACLLAATMGAATAQGDWQKGRATYYGTDGWSIHKGSCGFGYQYKDIGTGWDVAAIADASPEFAGSCGRCYEIRCEARSAVIDGYDNSFDRSGACKAGDASVVVRTVDNCPCQYPSNAYSNRRWCCNDHSDTQGTHFDMSLWAFEKLADLKLGVAGIEFRRVPCGYRPANPAPDGPSTMPASESPAALGYSGTPYAPANLQDLYQQKLVQRFDGPGAKQGAMSAATEGSTGTEVTLEQVLTQHGELSSSSGSASVSATASTGNGCTDVAPSGSTCQKEKDNKQCSKPWLLSGNYCRATCGRCTLSDSSSSSAASSDVSSNDSGSSDSGSSSSSDCTDVSPPGEADCQQQKAWGKCKEAYIVKSNYCAATCERCSGGQAGASSSSSSSSASDSGSASAVTAASASAKAWAASTKQQQPEQGGKVQAYAKASSRRSGGG